MYRTILALLVVVILGVVSYNLTFNVFHLNVDGQATSGLLTGALGTLVFFWMVDS